MAQRWSEDGQDPVPIELAALLRRANAIMSAPGDTVLTSHGLSRGQFEALAALHRGGDHAAGLTQAELAEEMILTQPGMKKRLDQLYDRGLLDRNPDPADHRRLVITLTDEGRDLTLRVAAEYFAVEAGALRTLVGAEQRRLIALLRQLVGDEE